jgi:hypothetical protein
MNIEKNLRLIQKEIKQINFQRGIEEIILDNVEIVLNYFETEFDPALKILNYSEEFDFEAKPLFYNLLNNRDLEDVIDDEEVLKEISELDMKFIFAYVEEISYLERFIMNPDKNKNKVKFNN